MPEQTTARRRPSPRPRPDDAAPGPTDERPHLTVVRETANPQVTQEIPDPEIPVSGSDEGDPTVEIPAGHSVAPSETGTKISGWRFRITTAYTNTLNYWTPPALFTDKPASLAELADYTRHAPWTQHDRIRTAGVWYYRGLAYPYTVISRYREWAVQRPLRLVAHLAVIKLFAHTTPGIWVVDHIVYPAASLAGHLFL